MITKTTQIPLSPLSPSTAQHMIDMSEQTAKVAMVQQALVFLSHHQDPVVQKIAQQINDLCVEPWIEDLKENDVNIPVGVDDVYDLVLPEKGNHVNIGRYDSCDVSIKLEGIEPYHIKVSCKEREGEQDGEQELYWVAMLEGSYSRNRILRMKIGDEVFQTSSSRYQNASEYSSEVKPGDVIEIMEHVKVRLHAPGANTSTE